ncbi:MAG: hypothetical protein RMJ48_08315 [Roseiflexaceae bacterium]|nr:hypothetical protein [Roseiflexaceae bacterium]
MFWRKSRVQAPHISAPSEFELQWLHEQAVSRRYDLRVCNPAHGGFYTFMARYKDAVDDADALEQLAEEIAARQVRLTHDAGLYELFGRLADLARWRARMLRAQRATA